MKAILEWFKDLGSTAHAALFIIITVIAGILFYQFRSNYRLKKELEYELERVRKEVELEVLEGEGEHIKKRIEELHKDEELILKKIKYLEEKDIRGEEVTREELEDFFKSRLL